MASIASQLVLIAVFPYLLTKLTYKLGTQDWLSPVVLCYLLGIAVCNLTSFPIDDSVMLRASQVSILLAIPLLLYSTDLLGWLKLARSTIISFTFVVCSVLAASIMTAFLFKDKLDNAWALSGMLTGVYIGGTPNMNAVGIALEVTEETFITLNAAEIVCGGLLLIFLTSFAHKFFGLFLKDFEGDKHAGIEDYLPERVAKLKYIFWGLALTLLLVGVSVGLTYLFTGTLERPGIMILIISTLSIAASLSPRIRSMPGTYETGEYLLLIFSIAIGLMADFREIFQNGGYLIAYSGIVMLLMIIFHTILCKLAGIDRDTMIITLTAGIYGPPFIGQVAAVMKNRSLVFSGIATGLVGLAIANFFGIAIGNLLLAWLSK
jgi:uncharacterized membrane protein